MNPNTLLPLIVTDKLAETKAFYTRVAGFSVTSDMDGYLAVRYGQDPDGPALSFMTPQPDGMPTERFSGQGLMVSIPTHDADATHAAMRSRGAVSMSDPSDMPWGWRSFRVADPSGVILDFYHVIDQSAVADATG